MNSTTRVTFLLATSLLLAGCPNEEPEGDGEICGDGIDNDGNGMADCADWACTEAADCSDDDTSTPEDSGEIVTDWLPLVINEFMASNETGLQDESEAFPDWIELYNPTKETVSLDGWMMSDDLEEPDKHTLSNLEIAGGDFLVLFADGDDEDGDRHLGFSLSADGEEIGLYAPDGQAMDRLEYGSQATDLSAARIPDGGDVWEITNMPTPGEPNRSSE